MKLVFISFSVLSWCHTGLLLEQTNERRSISVTDLGYDFLYVGIRFSQQLHCFFHFNVCHIVRDTDTGILTENLSHAGLRNGEVLSDGADLEVIREAMLLDIFHELRAKIRFGCNGFG